LPVEKLYLYGSVAHGRPTLKSYYDFLIVLDVDNQTLEEEITDKYHKIDLKLSRPIHTIPTYLYGFSRRILQPTEMEFYVHNYGKLLFDSGKLYTVKAKTFTTYAGIKDQYKFMKQCVSLSQANQAVMDTVFVLLLKLYTVKKAHMRIELQLQDYISFVRLFSDNEANKYINNYVQLRPQCNLNEMGSLCRDFENFIYSFRQEPNRAEIITI